MFTGACHWGKATTPTRKGQNHSQQTGTLCLEALSQLENRMRVIFHLLQSWLDDSTTQIPADGSFRINEG